MEEATIKAFGQLVENSLQSVTGTKWLNGAHAQLVNAYKSQKFNTERALEVYVIAIERAVLGSMKGPAGYATMKTLRETGITHKMASELVQQFKEATGAQDQRAARRGFLAKLLGK